MGPLLPIIDLGNLEMPPQLRPAAGASSPKLFAGLATIALWRLPCILGLALELLALQQRPHRRRYIGRASAGAGGSGFPFQIFPTMPLVVLSIQSSSWASTALIEKTLYLACWCRLALFACKARFAAVSSSVIMHSVIMHFAR